MNLVERLVAEFAANFELIFYLDGDALVVQIRTRQHAARLQITDETGKEITGMITINADKKRTFTVRPIDAKGRPARLDPNSQPEWTINPEGGVQLFPSADGLSCDVVWLAPMTGQVLTVQADADLGAGVRHITGTADIETLAPEAASFSLEASEESDV